MAGKIAMNWTGTSLVPANRAAAQVTDGWKRQTYMVDAGRHRNMNAHRGYWALCQYVANAVNAGPNPLHVNVDAERVSDRIKIATGHSEVVKLSRADAARFETPIAIMPKSISFAKMNDDEFGKFLQRATFYIAEELCPWLFDGPDRDKVLEILAKWHVKVPGLERAA